MSTQHPTPGEFAGAMGKFIEARSRCADLAGRLLSLRAEMVDDRRDRARFVAAWRGDDEYGFVDPSRRPLKDIEVAIAALEVVLAEAGIIVAEQDGAER